MTAANGPGHVGMRVPTARERIVLELSFSVLDTAPVGMAVTEPVDFGQVISALQSIESFWLSIVRLPPHSR